MVTVNKIIYLIIIAITKTVKTKKNGGILKCFYIYCCITKFRSNVYEIFLNPSEVVPICSFFK